MKLDRIKKQSKILDINLEKSDYQMYKHGNSANSDLNDGAADFIALLKAFSSSEQMKNALSTIYKEVDLIVGVDNDVYTNFIEDENGEKVEAKEKIKLRLLDKINAANKGIKLLLDLESETPYGMFTPILDGDFSDIVIHKSGIKVSDNIEFRDILIPKECMEIYKMAVDHFVGLVLKTSMSKLDKGKENGVLNAEMNVGKIGVVRYNIVHSSLNGRRAWPVVTLRKQTTNSVKMGDDYLNSLGLSENQVKYIKEASMVGATYIFGVPGSGKTTLMKYMIEYKIEEKRNPISIEDTAELNLDIPLTLVANDNYKIQDLFQETLRQNFSHIIIGESRDDTILDILESSLTSLFAMTSLHATSLPKAIQRIIMMSMPRKIPREDVENLIKVTVTSFIYIDARKVKSIWRNTGDLSKSVYDIFEEVK